MKKNIFFELFPKLFELEFVDKFNNLSLQKNKKISNKQYKCFISLIKQFRYLGLSPFKIIKFIKED